MKAPHAIASAGALAGLGAAAALLLDLRREGGSGMGGRAPEEVVFATSIDRWSRGLTGRWPLGTTQLSEELPAGEHELLARLPGGREARMHIELRPGETVEVALDLGPGDR